MMICNKLGLVFLAAKNVFIEGKRSSLHLGNMQLLEIIQSIKLQQFSACPGKICKYGLPKTNTHNHKNSIATMSINTRSTTPRLHSICSSPCPELIPFRADIVAWVAEQCHGNSIFSSPGSELIPFRVDIVVLGSGTMPWPQSMERILILMAPMPFHYCQGGWERQHSNKGDSRYNR